MTKVIEDNYDVYTFLRPYKKQINTLQGSAIAELMPVFFILIPSLSQFDQNYKTSDEATIAYLWGFFFFGISFA